MDNILINIGIWTWIWLHADIWVNKIVYYDINIYYYMWWSISDLPITFILKPDSLVDFAYKFWGFLMSVAYIASNSLIIWEYWLLTLQMLHPDS